MIPVIAQRIFEDEQYKKQQKALEEYQEGSELYQKALDQNETPEDRHGYAQDFNNWYKKHHDEEVHPHRGVIGALMHTLASIGTGVVEGATGYPIGGGYKRQDPTGTMMIQPGGQAGAGIPQAAAATPASLAPNSFTQQMVQNALQGPAASQNPAAAALSQAATAPPQPPAPPPPIMARGRGQVSPESLQRYQAEHLLNRLSTLAAGPQGRELQARMAIIDNYERAKVISPQEAQRGRVALITGQTTPTGGFTQERYFVNPATGEHRVAYMNPGANEASDVYGNSVDLNTWLRQGFIGTPKPPSSGPKTATRPVSASDALLLQWVRDNPDTPFAKAFNADPNKDRKHYVYTYDPQGNEILGSPSEQAYNDPFERTKAAQLERTALGSGLFKNKDGSPITPETARKIADRSYWYTDMLQRAGMNQRQAILGIDTGVGGPGAAVILPPEMLNDLGVTQDFSGVRTTPNLPPEFQDIQQQGGALAPGLLPQVQPPSVQVQPPQVPIPGQAPGQPLVPSTAAGTPAGQPQLPAVQPPTGQPIVPTPAVQPPVAPPAGAPPQAPAPPPQAPPQAPAPAPQAARRPGEQAPGTWPDTGAPLTAQERANVSDYLNAFTGLGKPNPTRVTSGQVAAINHGINANDEANNYAQYLKARGTSTQNKEAFYRFTENIRNYGAEFLRRAAVIEREAPEVLDTPLNEIVPKFATNPAVRRYQVSAAALKRSYDQIMQQAQLSRGMLSPKGQKDIDDLTNKLNVPFRTAIAFVKQMHNESRLENYSFDRQIWDATSHMYNNPLGRAINAAGPGPEPVEPDLSKPVEGDILRTVANKDDPRYGIKKGQEVLFQFSESRNGYVRLDPRSLR